MSPRFWPETRRGAERFVRELATGLIAEGHRPALLTSRRGAPRLTREDGLTVWRSPRPPNAPLVSHGFDEDSAHVPLSYAALRLGRFDLAQPVHMPDALAAARWGRVTGRPTVFSYMGIPLLSHLRARSRRVAMTRAAIDGCDQVVSLSRPVAEEFRSAFGIETPVIAPPVDVESFTPGGARHPAPTIFCAAAVAAPAKRVDMLVRAFALVRRDRPDARLVLSDPGDPEVAARVVQGVEGVELAVVDDTSALVDAYRESWVSVLPSVGEAFGLVLAEALACGTPVVGTDTGGIAEIVDRPGIGRLFAGEERDLARALLGVLDLTGDPAVPEACRARALDFSRERSVAAYQRIYDDVLERRG